MSHLLTAWPPPSPFMPSLPCLPLQLFVSRVSRSTFHPLLMILPSHWQRHCQNVNAVQRKTTTKAFTHTHAYRVRYSYNICVFCRTFRWKFNNSGETLDVGSERFSVNGSRSILKYTPVTDQVNSRGHQLSNTQKSPTHTHTDTHTCIHNVLTFIYVFTGLWHTVLLGSQWGGHTAAPVPLPSGFSR